MKLASRPGLLAALACLLISPMAQADTVFGLYAGAGTWQQESSGDVRSSLTAVDIEDDLGIEDDSNMVLYFAIEHGLPMLPNLRAQHFAIDVDGDNVLSRSIEFNGQTFTVADAVATNVDLTQSDAVLYYEMLDNVVSLDLGLAVSQLDGEIEIASSTEQASADFNEVIPMLYGRVRADLPMTGLWVGAEGQGMSYDGNSLMEFNAQVGWESDLGLGLEAGWRSVVLEVEAFDQVESAEMDVSGPYASLNFHF